MWPFLVLFAVVILYPDMTFTPHLPRPALPWHVMACHVKPCQAMPSHAEPCRAIGTPCQGMYAIDLEP